MVENFPWGRLSIVPRRSEGVWITNGRAAWYVPDRRVAAWLENEVIFCPAGWWVETQQPAGVLDLDGMMVHCYGWAQLAPEEETC